MSLSGWVHSTVSGVWGCIARHPSLTVLPDGTIGCYYEEDGLVDGYEMRFVRFSLKWLTDGADEISGEDVEVGIFDVPVGSQTEDNGYIYDVAKDYKSLYDIVTK